MPGLRNVNVPQFQGAGLNFVQGNPAARGYQQQQKRERAEDRRERQEEKRERRQKADKAMRSTVESMYAPEGGASPDPMSRMGGGSEAQASPGKQPTTMSGKLARVTASVPGMGEQAVQYASQAQQAQRERYQRETEQEMEVLRTAAEGQTTLAKQMAQQYGVKIPEPILEDGNRAQALATGTEIYGDDTAKLAKFLDAAEQNDWDLSTAMNVAGPPSQGGGSSDYGTIDEQRVRELARKEALNRTQGASTDWSGQNVTFDTQANPDAKRQFYQNYNAAYRRLARRHGGSGRSPYAGMGQPQQRTQPDGGQTRKAGGDDGYSWYNPMGWFGGDDEGAGRQQPQPQTGARANPGAPGVRFDGQQSGRSGGGTSSGTGGQRQTPGQRGGNSRAAVPDVVRNPGKIQDKIDNPSPPPASRKDLKKGEVYAHPKHGPVYYDGEQFWPLRQ